MSFFLDYLIKVKIKTYKDEKDEKIKNETYAQYNVSFMDGEYIKANSTKFINDTIYMKIYEISQNFFLYTYLPYYSLGIIVPMILYWLTISNCLIKDKEKGKDKQAYNLLLLEDNEIINDDMNYNNNLIKNNQNNFNTNNNKSSYTLCKICGFFYYSEQTDLRGDIPFYNKFSKCISDFCCLNIRTLIDCCNITFCDIINSILFKGKNICKCCCNCCRYCRC